MKLKKPNTAIDPPAAPGSPAASPAPARRRVPWLVLAGVGVLLAAAGWGAWSLWRPDPMREVHAALDRRDFRTAGALLAKRLAEHPDDREARLLAARTARRAGDPGLAADHLREYARRHAADESHDVEVALIRVRGGNLGEAERLFAAYSDRPESPDAPFVMEAYLEAKLAALAPRPDDQIEAADLEAAGPDKLRRAAELWLRLRPARADQVEGGVWLARVLVAANEQPAGVTALREALALDPDHFAARLQLALALSLSDIGESVRHLEVLRARHPENRPVRFGLVYAYRLVGRLAEARQLAEGLSSGPDYPSALLELARIDLDEGKLADAERRLRRVLELAPNVAEANIAMSRCQQLAGRPADAEKYRKRFEEIEAAQKRPAAPTPRAPTVP